MERSIYKNCQKFTIILALLLVAGCGLPKQPPPPPGNNAPPPGNNANNVNQDQQQPEVSPKIPGLNPLDLLKLIQVREDLGITKEQLEKFAKLDQQFKPEVSGEVKPGPNQSVEEFNREQQIKESQRQIAQVLTQKQFERYEQIVKQVYGWGVMDNEQVTEILGLTPEQEEKLRIIRLEMGKKMEQILKKPFNPDPSHCEQTVKENLQSFLAMTKETNQKSATILSEAQRDILKDLEGKKFELDFNRLQDLCKDPKSVTGNK